VTYAIKIINLGEDVLMQNQRGFSLIEVLVTVAIVVTVAAIFLSALATSTKATVIADQQATAESLARGQLEYIQNQIYSDTPWSYTVSTSGRGSSLYPSWWDADNPPLLSSDYAGYSINSSADDFDADGDTNLEVPGDDEGIRKITVRIYRLDVKAEPLITLEDYKVDQ